jgi:hypothetical protein
MKPLTFLYAVLFALAASAGEAPRYQLPSSLMARYKISPIPGLSRQGNPRPRYDWRLYGVSQQANGSTRFLFELTILHFNQLVDPTAKDAPFYHVGYFDVSPRGVIPPNETLVAYGDPQMLFPLLPEALPEPGETWTQPTPGSTRTFQALSMDGAWFRFSEELPHPRMEKMVARSAIDFDRSLGLVRTNQIVVSGLEAYPSTNRVHLVEYLFYGPGDEPIMVDHAQDYIDAVTRYLRAFPSALMQDDPRLAGEILAKARVDLHESTKSIRAPHLKVMLKRYEDGHAEQSRSVLQKVAERRLKKPD